MSLVFSELLLHANTQSQLETFLEQPGSALLLSGRPGSGKKAVARGLAAVLLDTDIDKLSNHPHLILVNKPEDKSEISIDSIRQVISKLNLRVAGGRDRVINRVVIIENAQFMSREAQNALLKLLEEPPANTLLILTTNSEDNLLPTVVSRTQKVSIIAPSLNQSLKYFDKYSAAEVESSWRLSQGGAGLLSALLVDEADHPLKLAVEECKDFIRKDSYHRLIKLQQISKDKAGLAVFLEALAKVLAALHSANINKGHSKEAQKLLESRKAVEASILQLEHNTNTRLISLALALNIRL